MSYDVWIASYSNEQLEPTFPWLWLARLYAIKTSKENPQNPVEILDSNQQGKAIEIYVNGKKIVDRVRR